jgi:peptidoglycan hydrolase-like protein with peptidoglycan-binding domain
MKKLHVSSLALLLVLSAAAVAQNTNSSAKTTDKTTAAANVNKRGPVFRATKDQIKEAQTLLKGRSLYAGEITGKLSDDTRASLRKFQEAEGLKVTGTLNRVTLEKMNIALTDKQKAIS